ncbi:DUF4377 domain-containing protein [Candidatus Poribacteria bacterium]|nr:DUF4377 domain-containing protein [Candidatus Poribacteria bacterium]MYH79800.1 DUF4377 domain-containing protein [Candidatus Poribacteria bacterium]MYK92770.1 DUF4377 domain-containing protein [Candidatus Poribacteria bacterium]
MLLQTKHLLSITLILLLLIIGCNRDEHIETLIIGPYKVDCVGAFEQECYLEFNEERQRWEFFYEGIQGFDFEPGFIWTLKVSLHEREEGIQDVGRYEYRLVEVLDKEAASVDERPPRKP